MPKKNRDGRKTQLKKKLIAYSAAAGATLALAQPVGAGVVYSGIKNIPLSPPFNPPAFELDMNGDATIDFTFRANSYDASHFVWISGPNSALKDLPPAPSFFKRLPGDYAIGQGAFHWDSNTGYMQRQKEPNPPEGNFINQTGFIGVRFQASGQTLNGWIRYQGIGLSQGRIIDWAYETDPARDIVTPPFPAEAVLTAVPTLNEWGLMILAALILAGGARRVRKLSSNSS